MLVLVVDDDADVRDAIAAVLQDEGCDVDTATDGRSALSRLGQGPRPSVVLMDLMMPVMDGTAAYNAMQADPMWREIPVVAMSASHRSRTNAVFPFFVEKPVTVETLMETLKRAAGR